MNINVFSKRVAQGEGKNISLSIAQIKEVLSVVNTLTGGFLYIFIRGLK